MRRTTAIVLFAGFASAAWAHDGKLPSLLRDGYEIKAAYMSEGRVKYVLQKGASVFECWAHEGGTCLLIN